MARGGLHPLVIRNHPTFASADDEEVLRWPLGATLLPEALVSLLDLLVLGRCEAVTVLLAHHGYRPVALVKAIARRGLTVTQQPIQFGLDGAWELLNTGIEVGLIGLGAAAQEARVERALVGRLIAMHSSPGHDGEIILGIRLGDAGDIGAYLSIPCGNREAAESSLLDGILTIRIVDDPGFVHGLGDTLLLGNATIND